MQVKSQDYDNVDAVNVVDETESTNEFCLANISDTQDYMSCGERLRRRKNGVTWCPVHGDMH